MSELTATLDHNTIALKQTQSGRDEERIGRDEAERELGLLKADVAREREKWLAERIELKKKVCWRGNGGVCAVSVDLLTRAFVLFLSRTHSLTCIHSLYKYLSHTYTHTLSLSLSLSLSLIISLSLSLSHTYTYTQSQTLTHTHTHTLYIYISHTHSLSLSAAQLDFYIDNQRLLDSTDTHTHELESKVQQLQSRLAAKNNKSKQAALSRVNESSRVKVLTQQVKDLQAALVTRKPNSVAAIVAATSDSDTTHSRSQSSSSSVLKLKKSLTQSQQRVAELEAQVSASKAGHERRVRSLRQQWERQVKGRGKSVAAEARERELEKQLVDVREAHRRKVRLLEERVSRSRRKTETSHTQTRSVAQSLSQSHAQSLSTPQTLTHSVTSSDNQSGTSALVHKLSAEVSELQSELSVASTRLAAAEAAKAAAHRTAQTLLRQANEWAGESG